MFSITGHEKSSMYKCHFQNICYLAYKSMLLYCTRTRILQRDRTSAHTYKDVEMRRHLLWKLAHTMIEAETSNDVICKLGNKQDK